MEQRCSDDIFKWQEILNTELADNTIKKTEMYENRTHWRLRRAAPIVLSISDRALSNYAFQL